MDRDMQIILGVIVLLIVIGIALVIGLTMGLDRGANRACIAFGYEYGTYSSGDVYCGYRMVVPESVPDTGMGWSEEGQAL